MKIAVMMRAMDQDSGFRVYVERLVEAMLDIDSENFYFLLYRTTKLLGCFSQKKNVKEILIKAPHKLIWDQVAVPYRAWKEGADIIFNPKFSVPLVSHCPVAMGLQEPAWWAWPEHYERMDVCYQKVMLPLYCRKASHFFPLAEWILQENRKYLKLPFNNSTVTYPAADRNLGPIKDSLSLEQFRVEYKLPQKFILAITRVDHPGLDKSKSFYVGKNVQATLRAFLLCKNSIKHSLVIAGRHVREFLLCMGFKGNDFERVYFTDFIPFAELAKLYNLAELIVVPPFYEGFGFTLIGAMACGLPVVASKTGACPEVIGEAGLLADPYDFSDFAEKIMLILKNGDLRQHLKEKSLERAAFFNWEQTAKRTVNGLVQAVARSRG